MADRIETVEGVWDGRARNLAGLTKLVVNTAKEQALPVDESGLVSDVQGEEIMYFLSEVEKKLRGERIPGKPKEVLDLDSKNWTDLRYNEGRFGFDLNFLSRYLHLQGYRV